MIISLILVVLYISMFVVDHIYGSKYEGIKILIGLVEF